MIAVDIISKIVSKGTGKAPSTVGGESSFDLSDYLLKEIWEKVFEIKTDAAGNEYIFGKLPVVTKYGITMYGEELANVPSIFEGLPIDGQTLVWKDGVLGVNPELNMGGGASSLGELLNVDASIDATASVDRVLYQPAGSAMWTWRELPKDGVVGDYLPLSGGTINGNSGLDLIINTSYSEYNLIGFKQNNTYMGYVGVEADGKIGLYSYVSRSYLGINSSGEPYVQNDKPNQIYTILHSGNYSSYALPLSGGTLDGELVVHGKKEWSINAETSTSNVCASHIGGYGMYIGTTSSSSNIYALRVGGSLTGASNVFFTVNANGNVGIGTTSPSEKLQVEGNCWLKNGRLYALYASFDDISSITDRVNYTAARIGTFDRTEGGFVIQLGKHDVSNAGWRQQFSIINSGWTETLFSVDRSGNVIANGGITMYSDIRKKTKLQDVELSLSQIANAPLIQHYYNSDQEKTTHVGSIAQYWANLNDWFCKLDAEGFYTMEIQNCALASAISIARHLEKYESKTDKKIRKLKKRVQELEDKLEKLEGGNYGCN